MSQPKRKLPLANLRADGQSASLPKQSAVTNAAQPSSHPNAQPTDAETYTQQAVNYPVTDHPNPTQGSIGYQQQKTTVASMNEEMHNRKHKVITDQNVGEIEVVQKIAKAKKAADKAMQAERERYNSP